MKTRQQIYSLFTVLIAASLICGCGEPLSENNPDESGLAIEKGQSPLGEADAPPPIPRSPLPQGDGPPRRQMGPVSQDNLGAQQENGFSQRSSETDCEAANMISSTGPALVFNQPIPLQNNLPLSDVLSALSLSNGGLGTVAEQEAIIDSMTSSFTATQMINSQSGTTISVQPRPDEAAMIASDFIAQMQPVAAFNRLDLMSDDGSDCGEHRLIFNLTQPQGNQTGGGNISGQFTLIFEARYPNPNPSTPPTVEDCAPVAQFWANLVSLPNDTARASALRDFFLTGTTVNNVVLPPVINFAHFQGAMGQIRTNQFVDSPWQLREFRTDVTSGAVTWVPDTNKGNPITALYNQQQSQSLGLTNLRNSFVTDLVNNQLPLLLQPELLGLNDPTDILVGFEPAFDDEFSGFTSVSQGNIDNPSTHASPDLVNDLQAGIDTLLGTGPNVTVDAGHVLNRLGAMTCGGCHQFSAGDAIDDSVNWPSMGGTPFVHVSQTGTLSPGLVGTFLPKRRGFLLDTFLCEDVVPECEVDADCPGELICVAGECIEPVDTGCDTNADCPYGEICVDTECVEPQLETSCESPEAHLSRPPQSVRGTTRDSVSVFEGSCGGVGAEDVVVFQAPQTNSYCINTRGSLIPTVLYVRQDRCESPRSEISCSRTSRTAVRPRPNRRLTQGYAQLEIEAIAHRTYHVFIDSDTRTGGSWQLNITPGPCNSETVDTQHTDRETRTERPAPSVEMDDNMSAHAPEDDSESETTPRSENDRRSEIHEGRMNEDTMDDPSGEGTDEDIDDEDTEDEDHESSDDAPSPRDTTPQRRGR